VAVPCKFINEGASPGLKRGGVLNIVRHEVEVYCHPDNIPSVFNFDLTGLDIGRSVHISATKLPEGVETVIRGRDFTVATIAGAKAEEEETTTAAAATADGAAPAAGADGAAAAGDAKAGGKAAAPAAGGKAAAPAAGGKAAAAPAAKPAAKK
jgi:large subunit ribosomal protein L25